MDLSAVSFSIALSVLCSLISVISSTSGNSQPTKGGATPTPIVMWHGMGDSCCARGIGGIQKMIEANISGVFVHSIQIGKNEEEDFANSYFMPVNTQVDTVCQKLSQIPELQNGYHAIGFSQGGQFL
ncbi:hypothetical protein RvY_10480-3 [Ramazzottius varieornatus]|nr:hypothetical protein RvY_10480-3 [Ramazzottius varieornatus]